MNKEEMQDIKERLDLFPESMNKEAQEGYYKLFDYINSLQQENKQQKEQLCNRSDCSGRIIDSNKCDSLQQRIDKAIEYINKEENMKLFTGAFSYGEFIGTLEEILRGDSNE